MQPCPPRAAGEATPKHRGQLKLSTKTYTVHTHTHTCAPVHTHTHARARAHTHTRTHRPNPSAHSHSSVSRLKTIKQNARTKHAKTKPLPIPSAPAAAALVLCSPSKAKSLKSHVWQLPMLRLSHLPSLLSLDLLLCSIQAWSSPRPAGATLRPLVRFSALEPESRVSSTRLVVPPSLETGNLGSHDTTCSCICSVLRLTACPPLSKRCPWQSPRTPSLLSFRCFSR